MCSVQTATNNVKQGTNQPTNVSHRFREESTKIEQMAPKQIQFIFTVLRISKTPTFIRVHRTCISNVLKRAMKIAFWRQNFFSCGSFAAVPPITHPQTSIWCEEVGCRRWPQSVSTKKLICIISGSPRPSGSWHFVWYKPLRSLKMRDCALINYDKNGVQASAWLNIFTFVRLCWKTESLRTLKLLHAAKHAYKPKQIDTNTTDNIVKYSVHHFYHFGCAMCTIYVFYMYVERVIQKLIFSIGGDIIETIESA